MINLWDADSIETAYGCFLPPNERPLSQRQVAFEWRAAKGRFPPDPHVFPVSAERETWVRFGLPPDLCRI